MNNNFEIKFEYNEHLSYHQFESTILNAFSYNYNIRKYNSHYGQIVYNLYIYIGDKRYNLIVLYPYLDKDVSIKQLYNIWTSNIYKFNLHIVAKIL